MNYSQPHINLEHYKPNSGQAICLFQSVNSTIARLPVKGSTPEEAQTEMIKFLSSANISTVRAFTTIESVEAQAHAHSVEPNLYPFNPKEPGIYSSNGHKLADLDATSFIYQDQQNREVRLFLAIAL